MPRIFLVLLLTLSGCVSGLGQTPQSLPSSTPPATRVPRFAFLTNIGGPTQVFAIDGTTGMLRQTGVLPNATNSAVLAHPSGRFLYFVGSAKIVAYAVNPNGTVTPVPGSPF